jgi:hypothetical protein
MKSPWTTRPELIPFMYNGRLEPIRTCQPIGGGKVLPTVTRKRGIDKEGCSTARSPGRSAVDNMFQGYVLDGIRIPQVSSSYHNQVPVGQDPKGTPDPLFDGQLDQVYQRNKKQKDVYINPKHCAHHQPPATLDAKQGPFQLRIPRRPGHDRARSPMHHRPNRVGDIITGPHTFGTRMLPCVFLPIEVRANLGPSAGYYLVPLK